MKSIKITFKNTQLLKKTIAVDCFPKKNASSLELLKIKEKERKSKMMQTPNTQSLTPKKATKKAPVVKKVKKDAE